MQCKNILTANKFAASVFFPGLKVRGFQRPEGV
ncbi:hypothetical protein MiSe_49030 [Microseira wollei NIES-4236]|uniref:Transposase n=1 Tax=Microseira wollei NIES-4236 TaxID=2530354 RepID=A0AAV3XGN6_9CYAN|nr:hypothetical protein MiSe_49030 [Microseira wollei NIES-4236]